MSVSFTSAESSPGLLGRTVFLSASIPDPARYDGPADPLAITDAVVAFARVFLTAGARIVTAAHPTIAPLLLYVAAELPAGEERRIVTYQSELFEDVLPPDTRRFLDEGIGQFKWTAAAEGERPKHGEWDESLRVMRRVMLSETEPAAAAFVGGMEGIPLEFEMFSELFPGAPIYAAGRPGGESRSLVELSPPPVRDQLLGSAVFPAVWRSVAADLASRGKPRENKD